MFKDVYVTGIGVISSIGQGVSCSLNSFELGRTGIGNINILDTIHKGAFKVGEINLTNNQLMELLGVPFSSYKRYTRTSLLGMIAAKEAVEDAGLSIEELSYRTAIVSGTTVGGMDKTELDYFTNNYTSGFIQTHPCGDSTNKIADYLGIKSYRATISTACSSAANAIMHGAKLIKHGYVERAIVGGVDSLCKFTLNGFNSLMILDSDFCKPFDNNRSGLNLGEGAGFLVLESNSSLKCRSQSAICRLAGYANSNDAYHQTASSPDGEGAYISMHRSLLMSDLTPSLIDYINVHGTGTINNDFSEGVAIKRVFSENIPCFSSTKSFTGHTLGASAGIEAVFSVMSIKYGLVYPNLNFSTPITGLDISPQLSYLSGVNIRNVLSNSFGFGGNNTSLIFSK